MGCEKFSKVKVTHRVRAFELEEKQEKDTREIRLQPQRKMSMM